jgi:hypothetical protein
VNILILFLEEDRALLCQAINRLQDRVQWCGALGTMEEKRGFRRLDQLWFPFFEDPRCTRILRFPT